VPFLQVSQTQSASLHGCYIGKVFGRLIEIDEMVLGA
jgi:hypothetical protein